MKPTQASENGANGSGETPEVNTPNQPEPKREVFSLELRMNEGISEPAEFVRITARGRRPLPPHLLLSLGGAVADLFADFVGDYVGANNITIEASPHIDVSVVEPWTQPKR